MLSQLFPRLADNRYRGSRIALWLFGAVVLMRLAIALGCIFNGYNAAASADGIPLDTFPPAAAGTIVSMFAAWGLAQVFIGVICVLVLVRYRSMVPLMFVFILLEHLARRLIFRILPVPRTGTPPGFTINLVLLGVMIIGVVLSLLPARGEVDLRAEG
jgi:hypothetical protein